MTDLQKILADNLAQVRERMARATQQSSRTADSVKLIAVTKYIDADTTAALLKVGCPILGESRPQQLQAKSNAPGLINACWHLIGHLQRNKVRATLPLTDLIHSVDSQRLLKTINTIALEQGQISRVLLELNCSGDREKHGLTAEEFKRLLPELGSYPGVQVCGLMTMAARSGGEQVAGQNFAALRSLRDAALEECPPEVELTELSMGMSHDFEIAIREGATMVRIGSLLFEGLR
ncbi:MAG: YggS family pyridoxal phosphate-dependent enzyme [Planctomycetaceae bacterium]|nr:YggS family pyridoxal phosphate-dependent enzyme [Planctomycetaceae bacterium]